MSEHIIIRNADQKDISEASRVLAASWKHAYKDIIADSYLDALPDDHWAAFLEAGISAGKIGFMVAELNGCIIGVSILRKSMVAQYPEDGEIVSLYLLPQHIGTGAGYRLYRNAEDWLKQNGYACCVLNVLAQNRRAIRFYKKMGFEDTGYTEEVTISGQTLLCITIRKPLQE